MNLQYERIEQLCRQLGLQTVASQWSHHAQQTLAKDGNYADFVEAMLLHEYTAKQPTYENHQINAVDMHRENLDTTVLIRYPVLAKQNICFQN